MANSLGMFETNISTHTSLAGRDKVQQTVLR